MALARALLLAAAAVLLAGPIAKCQKISFKEIVSSGGSSVQVAPSESTGMMNVFFTLAPCTGLQPHVHNGSELAQTLSGKINVGIVLSSSDVTTEVMSPGYLSQVPVGKVHYYFNAGCETATLLGTFDYGTTTQFLLQFFDSMPTGDSSFFFQDFMPTLVSRTPPFAVNAECLARCPPEAELAATREPPAKSAAPLRITGGAKVLAGAVCAAAYFWS